MEKNTKRKMFAASASAALVASAVVPAATFAETADFTDINNLPSDEQAAINALVNDGVINGKGDGIFDPYAQMKRAEAATVVAKLLNLDVEGAPDAGFDDVADGYWAKPYIDAAVSAGVLEGKGEGEFDPETPMKRAEFAQLVVKTFGLERVDGVDHNFGDVADNYWGKEAIEILHSHGLINGKSETRFAPEESMQRNHVALLVQRAVNDGEIPTKDLNVQSVSAITNTSVTVEITELSEGLTDANVVVRNSAGQTVPTEARNLEAGTTEATFYFESPLTYNPGGDWTVNGIAYDAGEFAVVDVEPLTSNAKYVDVMFNQPIESLNASEVVIRDSVTLTRAGIESVQLSSDGMSAQITLLGSEDDTILERGRNYTVSVTKDGVVSSSTFEMPYIIEEQLVRDVDFEDRKITIETGLTGNNNAFTVTLDVPSNVSMDLAEVVARDLTVWYNSDNEVIRFVPTQQDVKFDAIEIDGDEVELIGEDKTYDFATNFFTRENGEVTGLGSTEYDYAKVVFNRSGDVVAVDVYNWNDVDGPILVTEVDEDHIVTYDEEFNFEDITIVKDGKTISLDDINEGDAVFFNDDKDAEYAEVYNNKVTGEIEEIYSGYFVVDGKEYEINGKYLDDDELKTFGNDAEDVLEEFQESGEPVTVYLDRKGDVVFLTGEMEEVISDTAGAFLEENVVVYQQATRDRVELEYVDEYGESNLADFQLRNIDEITVDDNTFEVGETIDNAVTGANQDIEQFVLYDGTTFGTSADLSDPANISIAPVWDNSGTLTLFTDSNGTITIADIDELTAGTAIEVVTDSSDNVVGLNVYESHYDVFDIADEPANTDAIEVGSNFITVESTTSPSAGTNSYRVTNSTKVFLHDDGDFEEVVAWGDITAFDEIDVAEIYYNGDEDVDYLVVDVGNTNIDADEEEYDAVITSVRLNAAQDEIRTLTALVNGQERTFTGLSLEASDVGGSIAAIQAGKVFTLTVDNDRNLVTEIAAIAHEATGTAANINSTDRTLDIGGDTDLQLTDDAIIVDASDPDDIETISLRELRNMVDDGDVLTVTGVRAAAGSNYINKVVITNNVEAGTIATDVSITGSTNIDASTSNQYTATVVDAGGNAVQGVTVTFDVTSGDDNSLDNIVAPAGGSTTATTNASGVAEFTLETNATAVSNNVYNLEVSIDSADANVAANDSETITVTVN